VSISSYPKVYNLGHKAISSLLDGTVVVQEKLDGSQLSFSKDTTGQVYVRSRGQSIYAEAPEKMFAKAVEVIQPASHPCEFFPLADGTAPRTCT